MKSFKAFILCLTVLITAQLLSLPAGAFGTGSDGLVYYNRATTVYPVMNRDTYTRSSFLSGFVGSDNNSVYNIAPAFWKEGRSTGASSMPDYLTFGTSFQHKNNDNTYRVYYQYRFEEAIRDAAQKGDLQLSFIANLTNDEHWNASRHLKTWTAYPTTWVSTYEKILIKHDSGGTHRDTTLTFGKTNFVPIGTFPYDNQLFFGALGQNCSCGSSKVSNISMLLADTTGPKVKSIYTTRLKPDGITMEPFTDFKAGDTLYINLKFDENIRFANDEAMDLAVAPRLKFRVKRIGDNIEQTGIWTETILTSLDTDTLSFKYTVPESYVLGGQGVKPNYYIYEIEPYQNQLSWISNSQEFDLKLFGKKTSQVNYLSGTYKSTSRIVDLAGNPIDIGASTVTLKSPAYMDNEVPAIKKIDIAVDGTANPLLMNRSDVFSSIGEKIGFFVFFSEEMLFTRKSDNTCFKFRAPYWDAKGVVLGYDMQYPFASVNTRLLADLNISKSGIPVRAVAKYISSVQDGKNGPQISKVYFEMEEAISSNMVPTIYNSEQLPIGINRIYLDTGKESYAFADARGNFYSENIELVNTPAGTRMMPAQQLWLDTVTPTAMTFLTPTETPGNIYKPFSYLGGDPSAFFIPVRIYDENGPGLEYRSLTNGVSGTFMWRDNTGNTVDYAYQYAVTGSPDQPTSYLSGVTGQKYSFTQIDSGNYIHIRILGEVDYNIGESEIVLFPVDNAANVGEVPFALDYQMDRVGPRITKDSFKTNYYGFDLGSISTNISVKDVSNISSVDYQWTNQGVAPGVEDWIRVSSFNYGSTDKYKAIVLARNNLASNVNHKYTLHVRGTDVLDYTTTVSYNVEYNLTLPRYNIEFVTNTNALLPKQSVKLFFTQGGEYYPPVGMGDRILVLVKKPAGSNEYWARSFRYPQICGEDAAVDIFDISPEAEGWTSAQKSQNAMIWWPNISGDIYDHSPLNTQQKEELYALFNQSYRQLELTVIAWRPMTIYSPDTMIPNSELHSQDVYILNFASGSETGTSAIHYASITPQSKVSYGGYYANSAVLGDVPTQPSPPRNLDGAVFRVSSLRNVRVPAYGLVDIDFDSADTNFALYKTGEGASDTPLFITPLIPKASQDIGIPANVATATGTYKVVVSVKSKATGRIDKMEYSSIMVDGRVPDIYGVSQVKTRLNLGGGVYTDEVITPYAVASDSRASEIFVSAAPYATQSILFKANLPSMTFGSYVDYAAYIKVWNATADDWQKVGFDLYIPTSDYKWIYLPEQREYRTVLLNSVNKNSIIDDLRSYQAYRSTIIPILPGENVIRYQIATTSGYVTPVQTLLVQAGSAMPTIEMMLSPDKITGTTTSGDVLASIKALGSTVVSPDTLQVGLVYPSGVTHEVDLKSDFKANRQVSLTKNGDYYFYVYDKYHNFNHQKVTIDYIDREAPTLAVTNLSNADKNTFDFEVALADTFNMAGCKLYMGFDDAYSGVLGVDPGTVFEVPTTGQWTTNARSQNGLYTSSVASGVGSSKVVSFSGAFKQDGSNGASTAMRTITLYAVDGAGNKSDPYNVTLTTRNEPTTYLSGVLSEGSFSATFSKPVLLTVPNENTLTPVYTQTKANLPFYTNGVYPIKYSDIFGGQYESVITVNAYEDLYNSTVSISETAPTNQNVQVLINAAFNPKIILELPLSIPGAVITPVLNAQSEVVGAAITMTKNGTFSYKLKPIDTSLATQTRTISIGNIDKIPPVVDLNWVYTSDVIAGLTAGEIIVSLQTNEELKALQNTRTTHIFTLDDQTPYTFHFSDLAGNSRSIIATPPARIVEKASVELDFTQPDYEMSIYQNVNGTSTKVASFNKMEYDDLSIIEKADAFPLFSGVMQLSFQVFDENQTVLSIKGDPVTGAPVPGVSVRGTTITVSDNADFTVVITDANRNETLIPVRITNADNTPPVGTVTYVKTGAYSIRGYLTMSDDREGVVTLKNTRGVLLETEAGDHYDKYYHDFFDNESFTFLFSDEANNNGSVIAVVNTLDMTAPTGTVFQWVPYFIDANGNGHKGQLSDIPTNSNVSVYLQFTKPIKTVTPSIVNSIGSLQDITVTQTEDSATVLFRQNAKVKLAFIALNGKSGSTVLQVDIIDKSVPVIESTSIVSGSKLTTYTFTSNEPVLFEDGENTPTRGTSFTKSFALNGEYYLKFTDRAGNFTLLRITVSGIDRVAPSVSIVDLPATKESVVEYNQANGTTIAHNMTNASIVVKASINEAGTIAFNGASYTVTPGQQVPLTITYNGIYDLVATDLAGMTTRYQFRIDCIDKSKPQILLPGGNLLIKQGTAIDIFEAKALEKVLVTDNNDMNPVVILSTSLTTSQLNTPGTYSIAFTATDKAGNSQTTASFVRVYDQNALEVLINGELAQQEETRFVGGIDPRVIHVTVNNLPTGTGGNVPYKMYWKPGLNTPGQMKNATVFSGSFTAPKDGFYTLYMMTQSKESFITYIYIQQ